MSSRILPQMMRQHLQMYLVLGSVNCLAEPGWVVQEALAGGATMVQFREKGLGALTGVPMFELARQLQDLCRHAGVPFIINDDVELALELDADGVHIGQDDESADSVRERIGNRVLGVSAHTIEEARRAILQGADYLGVGPIYPTISKDDAHAVQGPAILYEMRKAGIDVPIVGIGGITVDRVEEVARAGADGVAVISAVTQSEQVRGAVKELNKNMVSFLKDPIYMFDNDSTDHPAF
ncbi:Thiamine-phosphate synthase [Paenibacillus polymyxa E681]|uniref:thiamine phosphate synthase n=1 Tax=Paenibacillus polymyxa TaxID=1406 RepID=UPI0001E31E81|nr:thiamine phosphate synthase [Paenibacillus polymyxa]ADM71535.1 thiamine-phosphate pyrophosphorylase [Paenibacillus polymyxa E681]QNV58554.1 Thiamine-phosphate synthase [Paenibacillus polymyxa E681]QNV63389.1 Thiamine-phosphate synthase [Paenibacillus polymyxa E681]